MRITLISLCVLYLSLTACSVDKAERRPSPSAPTTCTSLLSECDKLISRHEYDRAVEEAFQALSIAEDQDLEEYMADAHIKIAVSNLMTNHDANAWNHSLAAETISRDAGYDLGITGALILKGKVCSYAGLSPETSRDDEGIEYAEEALRVAKEGGLARQEAEAWFLLSELYVNKNRWNKIIDKTLYAKAGECLSRAETIVKDNDLEDLRSKAFRYWIRYYRQGGKLEEALSYCNNSLEELSQTDFLLKMQLYEQLTSMYAALGRVEESQQSHEQEMYNTYKYLDSVLESKQQELDVLHETSRKQLEIERRDGQIKVLIISLILLLFIIIWIVKWVMDIKKHNAALQKANLEKEQLLLLVSKDFANPTLRQKNAVEDLVNHISSLPRKELEERCSALVKDAGNLNEEVAEYVVDLVMKRREMASSAGLTQREIEIIRLSSEAKTAREIAEILHLSTRTVSNHKQNIYSKLDVSNNTEMLVKAREMGIIS